MIYNVIHSIDTSHMRRWMYVLYLHVQEDYSIFYFIMYFTINLIFFNILDILEKLLFWSITNNNISYKSHKYLYTIYNFWILKYNSSIRNKSKYIYIIHIFHTLTNDSNPKKITYMFYSFHEYPLHNQQYPLLLLLPQNL